MAALFRFLGGAARIELARSRRSPLNCRPASAADSPARQKSANAISTGSVWTFNRVASAAKWAKAEGHCARLALVLFLARKACNETKATRLGTRSIDGAIKLIEYFKSHARRVYGSMADRSDQGRIGNALRWVKKHGGTVTARKANMYGLCKDSNEAKKLLKDLEELGHGTVTDEPRDSVVFRLNASTGQRDNGSE